MAELILIHSFWDVTKTRKEEWGKRNGEWGMSLGLIFELTLTVGVRVRIRIRVSSNIKPA